MDTHKLNYNKAPLRGLFLDVADKVGKTPNNVRQLFFQRTNAEVNQAVLYEVKKRLAEQREVKAEFQAIEKQLEVA